MAPILKEISNISSKFHLKKSIKHRKTENSRSVLLTSTSTSSKLPDKWLPLKKRSIAADLQNLIQLDIIHQVKHSDSNPIDLSKNNLSETQSVELSPVKIKSEDINQIKSNSEELMEFDSYTNDDLSFHYTNNDLSSDFDSSSNNDQNFPSPSTLLYKYSPKFQSTSISNNVAIDSDKEWQLMSKHRNDICTVFNNVKLQKELNAKLKEANIDEIDCTSRNTNMIRSFVPKERSEIEKMKRERNTEAARISRRKREILEKIMPQFASEKENKHNKLLKLKAAMINHSNMLDTVLEINTD